MSRFIILDSSPAGLITSPAKTPNVIAINKWLVDCAAKGSTVCLPEIIDYEVRRELLRAEKTQGIARLDGLHNVTRYLPLTTATMLRAATLWAEARQKGIATADPKRLGVDVILAAQALELNLPVADFVIATTNVSHLSRFVPAELWKTSRRKKIL